MSSVDTLTNFNTGLPEEPAHIKAKKVTVNVDYQKWLNGASIGQAQDPNDLSTTAVAKVAVKKPAALEPLSQKQQNPVLETQTESADEATEDSARTESADGLEAVKSEELTAKEKQEAKLMIDTLLASIDIEHKSIHENIAAIFSVFMLLNNLGHRLDRTYVLDSIGLMNEMANEIAKKQKGKEWIGYAIAGALQIAGGLIGVGAGVGYPLANMGMDPSQLFNAMQPASMASQGLGSVGGGTNTITEIFAKRVQADVELQRHFQTIFNTKSEDRRATDREAKERIETSRRAIEQLLNALHDTLMRMVSVN
jgi:hypothetical protein